MKSKKARRKKFDKEKFLREYDLQKIGYSEINKILEECPNKEQLLLIAEKRFGIPRGSNLRLTKVQLKEKILGAINHGESLEAIKRRASE